MSFDELKSILEERGVSTEGMGKAISIATVSKGMGGSNYGDVVQGVDSLILRWKTITTE